jgi:putative colanic acid biosynthesis acetyltransferase WcaF
MNVDLSKYSAKQFDRGAGAIRELLWLLTNALLFQLRPFKLSGLKCLVLRSFGAKIGRGVVIKPQAKITFPWKLTLGNHVWLGEESWLLDLENIVIADNVCISQRAFLCTGNHNYKSATFDLIVKPIYIDEGAWIGANTFVGPGVRIGSHAVLTAGSVATGDLRPFGIYRGNPAELVRKRVVAD